MEKQTKKGVLKYRMPDIGEGYAYLAMVEAITTNADVFRIKSKIIKQMGELIDFKELGYENYQEVLNDKENMRHAIGEIGNEIFNDILELIGKKD